MNLGSVLTVKPSRVDQSCSFKLRYQLSKWLIHFKISFIPFRHGFWLHPKSHRCHKIGLGGYFRGVCGVFGTAAVYIFTLSMFFKTLISKTLLVVQKAWNYFFPLKLPKLLSIRQGFLGQSMCQAL